MKKVSKYFILLASASLSFLMFSITAHGVFIDNDDSYGYLNPKVGYNTYVTANWHYRGDARTQKTGDVGNCYEWQYNNSFHPTSTYKINTDFYAYVNDASFTDPSAKYSVIATPYLITITNLNQNAAIAGWNYLGYYSITADGSGLAHLVGMDLRTNVAVVTSYLTAADGVRMDYTIQNNPINGGIGNETQ